MMGTTTEHSQQRSYSNVSSDSSTSNDQHATNQSSSSKQKAVDNAVAGGKPVEVRNVDDLHQFASSYIDQVNIPDKTWTRPKDHTSYKDAPFAGKTKPHVKRYQKKDEPDNFTDSDSDSSDRDSSDADEEEYNKKHSRERRVSPGKQAFLTDEQIARHWMFHTFSYYLTMFPFNYWLTRMTSIGMEKLDPTKGAMLVLLHSTHNVDIGFTIMATYKATGKVVRGLVHRDVMKMMPWLQYIGMVPGYRDTAVELLKQGYWCGVVPGGGEEACRGHDNKYNIAWPSKRKGFARVAIKAGVPLVPIFYQNQDEIRFNPIFYVWNLIGGSKVWSYIVDAQIKYLSFAVFYMGQIAWFFISFLIGAIPIPAKMTAIVGDPVYTSPDDDPQEVRDKVVAEFKRLIAIYQPHGIDRRRAVQMWFDDRKKRGVTLPDYNRQVEEDKALGIAQSKKEQ